MFLEGEGSVVCLFFVVVDVVIVVTWLFRFSFFFFLDGGIFRVLCGPYTSSQFVIYSLRLCDLYNIWYLRITRDIQIGI